MLTIHITPTLCQPEEIYHEAALVDIRVPELGLHLREGRDLVARKPFPNKFYLVASRNHGRKAMAGILIEAQTSTREFTVITRWALSAHHLLTHTVEYSILDTDYSAVSDNMRLWGELPSDYGGWSNRWPKIAMDWTPSGHMPRMCSYAEKIAKTGRQGDFHDTINQEGIILNRRERFQMPTLERDRVLMRNGLTDRLPTLESAFLATEPFIFKPSASTHLTTAQYAC